MPEPVVPLSIEYWEAEAESNRNKVRRLETELWSKKQEMAAVASEYEKTNTDLAKDLEIKK